ncbi:MAG: amidase family protein [Actinomycetota bacterium]|nr:amidase family protein [Actinomycetota bacterium]
MDFRRERVADLAAAVAAGSIGARELTQHALDRIAALNQRINAFVAVDEEAALAAAGAVDARVARGEDVGPLAGIPIGVKDLEDAAGLPTTWGSAAWEGREPAKADSLLVGRLRAAGCVVVGKTNTPEFGWKPDTENALFGATRNPWDPARSPGGSSGGSAAAIAAGMVPLATGSDGGGSIRIPSALCGISGMMPSLGRVPAGGTEPPGWYQLSSKGPLARSISDIAFVLDTVIGPDPADLRSLPMPESSWHAAVVDPGVPMKVGWSPTLGYAPVDDEVRTLCETAVATMADLGADVVEVDTVFPEDPVASWMTLACTYLMYALERFRGTDGWERVDPGVRAIAGWAASQGAVEVVKAEEDCYRLNQRLAERFREVRLLVTPTTAASAPRSGEVGVINGVADLNWVRFTYPFNLTRSPAATVCAGFTDDGLPVGLQLVGPQHGDLVVLRAAAALEEALGIDRLAPVQA